LGGSSLTSIIDQKNINFGFIITSIWPINPKAMDKNTTPLEVYIVVININNARSEEDYITKEEAKNN